MKPYYTFTLFFSIAFFTIANAQIPGTQNFWFVAEEVSTSIPTGMTITNADQNKYVVSIFDTDYLPAPDPYPAATLDPIAGDGSPDTEVNIQGVIGALNSGDELTVTLNYTATGPVDYPAFSQTISIPSSLIEGGGGPIDLTLSYDAGTTVIGDGTITAKIAAATTLNVKKLDIYGSGFNDSTIGYPLAAFSLSTDSSGGAGNVGVRILTAIPDRKFGDGVHDYLYAVATSPTGRRWLIHSLGASVTRIAYSGFDPLARINDLIDKDFAGNLFQFGRDSDGHEVIDYTNASSNGTITDTDAFGPETTSLATNITPGNDTFYAEPYSGSIRGRWTTATANIATAWDGPDGGPNNPCPYGFRVPTVAEGQAEMDEHRTLAGGAGASTADVKAELLSQPTQLWNNRMFRRLGLGVGIYGRPMFLLADGYETRNISSYTVHYAGYIHQIDLVHHTVPDWAINDGYQVRCIQD